MSNTTIEVPASGLCFAAPVKLTALGESANGERQFSGVAYGGGVITDHAYWDAVAFDMAGLTAQAPMPLLLQHDSDRIIGVIERVSNDGQQLQIAGRLFTGTEPAADSVARKADAGLPWQMSVGIYPDAIEQLGDITEATLNGRSIKGPAHIFRKSRVREVSFVALGADPSTRATVFNHQACAVRVPLINFNAGVPPMAATNPTPDLAAQVATLTTERDTAHAELASVKDELKALKDQFAAQARSEREAAVKALLGETFTAELAAPYMDMTPAQFDAVRKLAPAKPRLPEGFTVEQAHAGAAPTTKGKVTPAAIHKFRAENPGASYEQAFAALTAA